MLNLCIVQTRLFSSKYINLWQKRNTPDIFQLAYCIFEMDDGKQSNRLRVFIYHFACSNTLYC